MSSRLITLTPILSGGLRTDNNSTDGSITVSSDTTLSVDNFLIFCDTTSNSLTITLAATTNKNLIYIIDSGGNALNNNIIIQPASGNISGETNTIIQQNYGSLTLASDGNNYFII